MAESECDAAHRPHAGSNGDDIALPQARGDDSPRAVRLFRAQRPSSERDVILLLLITLRMQKCWITAVRRHDRRALDDTLIVRVFWRGVDGDAAVAIDPAMSAANGGDSRRIGRKTRSPNGNIHFVPDRVGGNGMGAYGGYAIRVSAWRRSGVFRPEFGSGRSRDEEVIVA